MQGGHTLVISRTIGRAAIPAVLPTTGTLTQLPPDKLAEVLDGVGAAVDKIGGSLTMPYTTGGHCGVNQRHMTPA
jgi:hypothetical protein